MAVTMGGWTQPDRAWRWNVEPRWHVLLGANNTVTFCGRLRKESWSFSYEVPRASEICEMCADRVRKRQKRGW